MEIAPSAQALHLISALSNTSNHQLHVQAIKARDEALSASNESYSHLCHQLALILLGSDNPSRMSINVELWQQQDPMTVQFLQEQPTAWIPFGQMAGLVLKQALLRPPVSQDYRSLHLQPPLSEDIKQILLHVLACNSAELRAVASSVIATVTVEGIQPHLALSTWPALIPTLLHNLQQPVPNAVEGSLDCIRKMLEDGYEQIDSEDIDNMVVALLGYINAPTDKHKVYALQALVFIISDNVLPPAMVLRFQDYLQALSTQGVQGSVSVRKWVCRSIVVLLESHTEYLRPFIQSIAQFMLTCTAGNSEAVALEACEFWLTFSSLDDDVCTPDMAEAVEAILPQLIPTLLKDMIYSSEQQAEILAQNELDLELGQRHEENRPIFHQSRSRQAPQIDQHSDDESDGGYEEDNEGDSFDDDDGNEWTLRKCAAASLDSIASLYGSAPVLPVLLPALQHGLSSGEDWVVEACILALGAVAEGCRDDMNAHMGQLHPFLMRHLAMPESPQTLPQVKSIAAWTLGRYASWAVEQVRSGTQGQLLATMTETFVARLHDRNRRVQIACCSALGSLIQEAGELMVPFLDQIFRHLVDAMSRFQGRSLLMIFDVILELSENCGEAVSDNRLLAIYMPPTLQMWNNIARENPSDRTLLPLMDCLASVSAVSGMNFQNYALECFEYSLSIIEQVRLELQTLDKVENEEDADPIVCAAELLDGLASGLKEKFSGLVSSSTRFGPHFLSVVLQLCKDDTPGVRASAFALLGDIVQYSPNLLENSLIEFIVEALRNMDSVQPTVAINAVWSLGEILCQCRNLASTIQPFAYEIVQNLTLLLEGNGFGGGSRGVDIPGLPENAAACMGRLALVDASYVAKDLSHFLMGWCDGLAKTTDPRERREGFEGFVAALYANPGAIQNAQAQITMVVATIVFAIISWHMPSLLEEDVSAILHGEYVFRPFPESESKLGQALVRLVHDLKASLGEDLWRDVMKDLPVNVRRLMRESYQLS